MQANGVAKFVNEVEKSNSKITLFLVLGLGLVRLRVCTLQI